MALGRRFVILLVVYGGIARALPQLPGGLGVVPVALPVQPPWKSSSSVAPSSTILGLPTSLVPSITVPTSLTTLIAVPTPAGSSNAGPTAAPNLSFIAASSLTTGIPTVATPPASPSLPSAPSLPAVPTAPSAPPLPPVPAPPALSLASAGVPLVPSLALSASSAAAPNVLPVSAPGISVPGAPNLPPISVPGVPSAPTPGLPSASAPDLPTVSTLSLASASTPPAVSTAVLPLVGVPTSLASVPAVLDSATTPTIVIPSGLDAPVPSLTLPALSAPAISTPGISPLALSPPALSVPAVSSPSGLPSIGASSLPALALPSAPGVQAEGLSATVSASSVGDVATPAPFASASLPSASIASPSLVHAPTATSIPPVIVNSASPDSLSSPSIVSTNLPTPSAVPSVSFLQVTVLTTVALTDTSALASLATLPANAGVSGLSTLVASPTPSASISSAGLPEATTPALPPPTKAQILEAIGVQLAAILGSVISVLAQEAVIPSGIPSVPGPPAAPAVSILPAPVLPVVPSAALPAITDAPAAPVQRPMNLTTITDYYRTTSGQALPTAAVPSLNLNGAIPAVLPPKGRPNVERALPFPFLPPSISTGGVPAVSSVLGGSAALPSLAGPSVAISSPAVPSASTPVSAQNPLAGIVGSLPILGSGPKLPDAGSIVLSAIKQIPIPAGFADFIQGAKNAAVAGLTPLLANAPLVAQVDQTLNIMQLLARIDVTQLGTLSTLTDIPALQSAVRVISQPDLATVIGVLENGSIIYSTAADCLLGDVLAFADTVEQLTPLVQDLRAAVSYVILEQLGLVSVTDVVNGTFVTKVLGGRSC